MNHLSYAVMMWLFIALLFILTRALSLYISTSQELEYYLCSNSFVNHTLHLNLNHSVAYEVNLKGNRFCYVSVTESITITSSAPVKIVCNNSIANAPTTIGFAFHGISVTLNNITFYNCGAHLSNLRNTTLKDYIGAKKLTFTPNDSVSLLFTECNITSHYLNITTYHGYAIMAVNNIKSNFSHLYISNNEKKNDHITGSGMLIIFFCNISNSNVEIVQSEFIENRDSSLDSNRPCCDNLSQSPHMHNAAAALTVLFFQNIFINNIMIKETVFAYNRGYVASAILVLTDTVSFYMTVMNCVFNGNKNSRNSSLRSNSMILSVKGSSVNNSHTKSYHFSVIDTVFDNHDPAVSGFVQINANHRGLVHQKLNIHFKNVTFFNCAALFTGSCLFASVTTPSLIKLQIVIESTSVSNSHHILYITRSSIFYFNNINCININGSVTNPSKFANNTGSVIEALFSKVQLSGNIIFADNIGFHGAALNLHDTVLEINSGNFTFIRNKALEVGGAIYVWKRTKAMIPFCSVQVADDNVNVTFLDNEASLSGNSMYGFPIYNCFNKNSTNSSYLKVFHFHRTRKINSLNEISTEPDNITSCGEQPSWTYPGETMTVYVRAQDSKGCNVFSAVSVDVYQQATSFYTNIALPEHYQIIQESVNCTPLYVTIFSNKSFNGSVLFSSHKSDVIYQFPVSVKHCPVGFKNIDGTCSCDQVFEYFENVKCYIANQTILGVGVLVSMWIGKIDNSFAISVNCPIGYCGVINTENWIKVTSDDSFMLVDSSSNLNYTTPLCISNRKGILCGMCENGMSIVLGSTQCMNCTGSWTILTVVLTDVIAGLLLIFLLFSLNLTLTTGTINGFVFYAHAANCGLFQLARLYGPDVNIPVIVLSFINCDIGLPRCFYPEMTELWKAGYNLTFPLYLFLIIGLIVILSRYSLTFSNKVSGSSVQVLVTVIHISFSKLLSAIIDVFSQGSIITQHETYNVWVWDGSVEYMSTEHCILAVFTSLFVLMVLIPYLFLILVGRYILKYRIGNKLRPFYEAIHGPYKDSKHYWFSARLILLIIMHVAFVTFRELSPLLLIVITAPLLALFTILQAYLKPFKSKFVNALDLMVMTDLVLLYVIGWYAAVKKQVGVYYGVYLPLVSFIVLLFVAVLIGHVMWVTGALSKLQQLFRRDMSSGRQYRQMPQAQNQCLRGALSGSFYGSCQFREPVLDF